jgi:hypothetical protein
LSAGDSGRYRINQDALRAEGVPTFIAAQHAIAHNKIMIMMARWR